MRNLTALLFFGLLSLRAAASDGSLSLSPSVVMLRGDYGQSATHVLTLTNATSRPFEFELVAQDVVTRDGKRAFVEAGSVAGSIAATALFSEQQVRVAPGESVRVQVTVTIPPATSQRAIVALFRGTNRIMSGNVPILASLGTLLTFSVTNDLQLTTAPLDIHAQTPTSNLSVSQLCTNSGHEPFVAQGVMAVLDEQGALVGKTLLRPHRLIPGESAILEAEHTGELDPGRYRVFVTYAFEGQTLSKSAEVVVR